MTRSSLRRSLAIAAMFGAFAIALPAVAQVKQVDKEPYYDDELVITVPYIRRDRVGVGANRAEEVSVSRIVSTRDLDLRYDSHVAVLRERIRDTAALVCDEAQNELRGLPLESDRECERDAVRAAMADANDLIDYRRG